MIKIILFGDLEDKKITKLLINNLEGKYNITYQAPKTIISYTVKNFSQEILIIETDSLEIIDSFNTIIIFKNNIKNNINLKIKNDVNIIVFSQNIKAIKFLNKSRLKNIITFGYKLTDSLTFSSSDSETKTICLQRQVKALTGKIIEPFELSIKNKINIFDLLPIYGVKILLER
ncbi:MAG: hypothetical protein J6C55_01675 [Oscillospiraceae bacterium]|nr:hypothetical protein [Oscillospiraceae bacterium]